MSQSSIQAAKIRAHISQIDALEDRLALWQTSDPPPSSGEVRAAHDEYLTWYTRAREIVTSADRARFTEMYEGSVWRRRVRAFLGAPLDPNPLFDPQKPTPLISRWAHPFELTFRDSATVQRELLAQSLLATAGESSALEELTQYFRRLPDFLSVLAQSRNPRVPTPDIQNEYDLQVLVHAMLRLVYDDVRAEDPVPQHAGGSSRVDFLIRESGVVIETKMTRSGLSDAKLGSELLVDWGRYPRHPDCRAIFAVVYDPNWHVKNPAGLEHDLSGGLEGLATRAIVVR